MVAPEGAGRPLRVQALHCKVVCFFCIFFFQNMIDKVKSIDWKKSINRNNYINRKTSINRSIGRILSMKKSMNMKKINIRNLLISKRYE